MKKPLPNCQPDEMNMYTAYIENPHTLSPTNNSILVYTEFNVFSGVDFSQAVTTISTAVCYESGSDNHQDSSVL